MKKPAALQEAPAALRYLLAMLSGALLAASFPTPGWSPLAWLALVPLFVAAEGVGPKESSKLAFCAGLTAYAGIFYWLNIVMVGFGKLHWTVSGAVYLVGVGYLALYPAAVFWLTRRAEERGIATVLAFPVLWVAAELVRSYMVVLGFPWASLGYSQYRTLPLIQVSDITGVYGVSYLVAFGNVVFYRMWLSLRGKAPYPVRSFATLLMLLVATVGYGFATLNNVDRGGVQRVLLVQGNIAQDVKWNPAYQETTVATYERLSRQGAPPEGSLVVWPESALPFYLQGDLAYAARVKSLATELKSSLVTGSPAVEKENGALRYLNSAFLISATGAVVGRSDKMHLVAFGEYVPLAPLLPFVNKLVEGVGDYSPGKSAVPLQTPQGKIGVLICFEGIFPEIARAYVQKGAGLLVNITNDAWFGNSSAPYQHLSMTVFRAVENRTPLVRAANTGISSVIDSKGHIRGMTPLFEEATLSAEVRRGSGGSFYSRHGDLFALACLAGSVVIASRGRRRRGAACPTASAHAEEPG